MLDFRLTHLQLSCAYVNLIIGRSDGETNLYDWCDQKMLSNLLG